MLWINLLKKLLLILQSEISPRQIAAGAVLGMILGFTPAKCLHAYLLFVLILMVNVNIASATLSAGVFALVSMLTDPLADKIGYFLLVSSDSLNPVWINLYNTPLVPFTRFNNTVVLGSLAIALLLAVPVYLFSLRFIKYYRANLRDKVAKWKIMKLFKLSSVYNMVDKYN